MAFRCEFLDLHLTTYHSHVGVQNIDGVWFRHIYLVVKFTEIPRSDVADGFIAALPFSNICLLHAERPTTGKLIVIEQVDILWNSIQCLPIP